MVSPLEKGGLNKARDADNNIINGNSTLRNILPPHLNKMNSQYKVICGCECCKSAKSIHYSLLTWRYRRLKYLKGISYNAPNRRSGEISSHVFET